jgi:HEAT repeat protein
MDSLVHELRNPDPAKRQKAIWELGRSGDSRAVQPMVDLLLDSDSRQRSLVLSALSEISSRTLKPMSRALAISMQDESPDVRKNAIRDLTHIYDSLTRISQLIQNACEDPDPDVQDTAKWAIGQINRIKSPLIQGAGRSVSQPESLN